MINSKKLNLLLMVIHIINLYRKVDMVLIIIINLHKITIPLPNRINNLYALIVVVYLQNIEIYINIVLKYSKIKI